MNKKLAVLIMSLITVVSAAYAVTTPAKSVVNPITQTLYVPDNGSAPARIRVYKRTENPVGWAEDTARAITAPSTTAKTFGLAVAPDGTSLYVSYANMNYSRLMIYPLDAQGNPGVGVSSNWVADTDASPAGLCFAGNRIYMADPGDGVVHVFNLQNGTPVYAGDLTDQLDGLSGIYDVAVTAPVNGAYKLFVSRKANSSTTDELFMYTVSNTGTITFTSSASLQFPTYMKVVGNNLYVSVNGADGTDLRVFDVSGNSLSATAAITSGIIGAYGWTGFDISSDGKWLFFTQAQDAPESSTKYYKVALPVSGTVSATPVSTCYTVDGAVVSPDNARLAVTYSGSGSEYNIGDVGGALSFLIPTFTSITPNVTTYGVPVTVTITGSNFFNSPVIKTQPILSDTYHDVDYNLTNVVYKSSTQMTATVNGNGAWQASLYDLEIANQDVDGILPNNSKYFLSNSRVFTINFTAPQTPQGFVSNTSGNPLSGGSLRWTWTANNQGESYYSLLDGANTIIQQNIPAATPTVTEDRTLTPNTQYTRKLKLYMENGLSAIGSAVTRYSAAAMPTLQDPTATATAVTLTWASGGNPSTTPYQVWRKAAGGTYAQITTTTATNHTDTAVTVGTTYTYKIVAINGDNLAGQFSGEKSILIPAPAQAPNNPISFQQYKADGVTVLPNGGSIISGTNVVLKFTVSGTSNPQLIAPFVKLDGVSQSLMAVNYTGTPITVSYTVTNPAVGTHIWDAMAMDYNTSLQTAWISSGLSFNVNLPAPTVSGITPNNGTQGSTTTISNLSGNNFVSGATIKLTKTGQTDIPMTGAVVTANSIGGYLPIPLTAATGTWNVVITNPDGQSATLTNGFTVNIKPPVGPTITGMTPNITSEGFTVNAVVSGTNFAAGATAKLTKAGNSDLPINVASVTANTITGTLAIPLTAAIGPWNLVVTNPDGQFDTLISEFTVTAKLPAPTIVSIDPNNGVSGKSVTIVNLIGTNFLGGATVKLINGASVIDATNVTVASPAYITCKIAIPAGATVGKWNVIVTNPDTQSATLANGFTVYAPGTAPTINSLVPNTGAVGKTVRVTNLAGTNFVSGATAKLAKTGQADIPMTNVSVESSNKISGSFVLPPTAQTGAWTVMVTNPDKQTGQLVDGFSVTATSTAPTITTITPSLGAVGKTVAITNLTGTNFVVGTAVMLSKKGQADIPMTGVTVVNATTITGSFVIPPATQVGTFDVTVTNPDGQNNQLVNGFTVTSALPTPTIASIDPNNGVQGNTVTAVNLIGTNFVTGEAVKLTRLGQPDIAANVTYYSSTYLSCTIPIPASAAIGNWDVVVTSPDSQSATLPNGFAVYAPGSNPPTITGITPNIGTIGTTAIITNLAGTNFASGATVKLAKTGQADIAMTVITVTGTKITGSFIIPQATQTGTWTVMVTNTATDKQTAQLVNGFTITSEGSASGAVSNLNIVRNGDSVGSSVTVSWQTTPANLAIDVYTTTGAYSTVATAWTKTASNITAGTYTDANQVGNGVAKYYKILPATLTLASSDLTKEVAGKFDYNITGGTMTLISLPLITSSTALSTVIGNQLTAGYDPSTAGAIYSNNANNWDIAWKDQTTGNWLNTSSQASTLTIENDKAYWVFDPANKKVTVVGLISNTARTKVIAVGWNFIGSSYPTSTPVAASGLGACTAGYDPSIAGALYSDNSGNWDIAWKDQTTGNWLNSNSQPSTLQLQPGKGYWFYEPTAPFTWNYPKAY